MKNRELDAIKECTDLEDLKTIAMDLLDSRDNLRSAIVVQEEVAYEIGQFIERAANTMGLSDLSGVPEDKKQSYIIRKVMGKLPSLLMGGNILSSLGINGDGDKLTEAFLVVIDIYKTEKAKRED